MVAEENRKGISLINERMDKLEKYMHSCTPRMKPLVEDIDLYPLEEYTSSPPDVLTTHEPNTGMSTPTHPKKRKQNKCVQYIKDALAKEFSREELAKGGGGGGVTKCLQKGTKA